MLLKYSKEVMCSYYTLFQKSTLLIYICIGVALYINIIIFLHFV